MLVRSISSLSVALLLVAATSSAQAEQGLPSQSALSEMGLAGITVMSDADAMAIRGFGYQPHYGEQHYGSNSSATAYGKSYASVSGHGGHAYSEDGFYATGGHHAAGKHNSHAGIVVTTYGGGHGGGGHGYGGGGHGHKSKPKPQVKKIVVFAGGSSYSSTK